MKYFRTIKENEVFTSAVQCVASVLKYSEVYQYNAVQYSAVQCSTVHSNNTVQCCTVQYRAGIYEVARTRGRSNLMESYRSVQAGSYSTALHGVIRYCNTLH